MSWLRRVLRAAFPESVPEVDLHGLRVPEALARVKAALRRAEESGAPEVRIVCGKGRHSPGGVGVLRDAVPGWLDTHGYRGRYRRQVEADGRDGALRVFLAPGDGVPGAARHGGPGRTAREGRGRGGRSA